MKKILLPTLVFMMFTSGQMNALADNNGTDKAVTKISENYSNAEGLIQEQRYAEAIEELDKVLSKDKKNADAWNLFGFAAKNMGNLVGADKAYARALSLNPEHLSALEYQGELFIMQGKVQWARSNLALLEKLCPDSCAERENLAEALAKAGE